jgi:predicted GNAT superfamily acetyltransferase
MLTPTDSDVRIVEVAADIVTLRRADPVTAQSWRRVLRRALVPAFEAGLEVVGVSRDSHYVLARPPQHGG